MAIRPDGAVHDSRTFWLPPTAVTAVGAAGAVVAAFGVALASIEFALLVLPFAARTWNVYRVPLVSVVTSAAVVLAPLPSTSCHTP